MTEKFLTVKETMDLLNISRGTIVNLLKNDDFPAVKIGGMWRIPYNRLLEYLSSTRHI